MAKSELKKRHEIPCETNTLTRQETRQFIY